MKDLSRNGYSHDEIVNMLHGKYGKREIRFRYDLLDKNENKKDELYEITGGQVEMSAFSNIKRTATFSLREESISERLTEQTTLEDYINYRLGEM